MTVELMDAIDRILRQWVARLNANRSEHNQIVLLPKGD